MDKEDFDYAVECGPPSQDRVLLALEQSFPQGVGQALEDLQNRQASGQQLSKLFSGSSWSQGLKNGLFQWHGDPFEWFIATWGGDTILLMVDDDRTTGPHPVELILAKQWAGLLSVPVFLLDASGNLVYYNGDAASLLGKSPRDEDGLSRTEWVQDLPMRDESGAVQDHLESPLTAALESGQAEQRECWILDRKQALRPVQVTAFPIQGLSGGRLGVMALFFVRD